MGNTYESFPLVRLVIIKNNINFGFMLKGKKPVEKPKKVSKRGKILSNLYFSPVFVFLNWNVV